MAARRRLPVDDVLGEVVTAAEATLAQVGAYEPGDWDQPVPSPVGIVPAHQAAEKDRAEQHHKGTTGSEVALFHDLHCTQGGIDILADPFPLITTLVDAA